MSKLKFIWLAILMGDHEAVICSPDMANPIPANSHVLSVSPGSEDYTNVCLIDFSGLSS